MQLSLALGDSKLPRVHDLLHRRHGSQCDPVRHNPEDQFVKAILSSCTKDAISQPAFIRLLNFVSGKWSILLEIHPYMIFKIIADVTYPEDKTRHLIQCISRTIKERSSFDLSFLADWPEDLGMSWLQKLPGVGPKIAAATLNFSDLRKWVFTVDRHVLRLGKRLGLLPARATFVTGFRLLMDLVPADWSADHFYQLHWLMKMHGQQICRPTHPLCHECVLACLCPSLRSNSQHTQITANASQQPQFTLRSPSTPAKTQPS
jgi:endonuclease-3